MPSPPLAPGSPVIDADHLDRVTLGQKDLAEEILGLFVTQADEVLGKLRHAPEDSARLIHTLKGAASAIGAFAVVDVTVHLEDRLRRNRSAEEGLARSDLMQLRDVIDDARRAIEGLLPRH